MHTLMVFSEEEFIEPSKTQFGTGLMKLRLTKKDYFRLDHNTTKSNRYAPEIFLTL